MFSVFLGRSMISLYVHVFGTFTSCTIIFKYVKI